MEPFEIPLLRVFFIRLVQPIHVYQAQQSVLNVGARLVTRRRKCDRITATLHDDLHWLPIHQRIMYELSTVAEKCLHETAPSYLAEMRTPVAVNTGRRNPRLTATHGDLLMPRLRTITRGPCNFAVPGRCVRNDQPPTT